MKIVSQWQWLVRQFTRELWLTALLYSIGAVISVLLGPLMNALIPVSLAEIINAESVDRVLGILASSMLAVTTFSLATMVSAHGAVVSNSTPRASSLIINNGITRNALGAFIGSFLFSLVGIVTLNAGLYGEKGHVVLFFATVVVIILIVATLLRWIDQLTRMAKVGEVIEKIEQTTTDSLSQRLEHPFLGGKCLSDPNSIPATTEPILSEKIGYVQHIDIASLKEIMSCQDQETNIYLLVTPGSFVGPQCTVARVSGFDSRECIDQIRSAFYIDADRTFDYDPRFGLIVLSEVASRALSPGVNDPGTAIDVIGRAVRILCQYAAKPERAQDVDKNAPNIWVEPLQIDDLFDDIFSPIVRDGAGVLAVQIRLQKAFKILAELDGDVFLEAAKRHSKQALALAESEMRLDFDKDKLRKVAQTL